MTRIFQPEGVLSIDYQSQRLFLSRKGTPVGMVTEEIPVQKNDPLEVEIRSFLQCVRSRKSPRVSGLDGRRALGLALQIIQQIGDLNKKKRPRDD
jgi:predicted dehydrogenase